jgi:phospholipid-translocating ATPase
MYDEVLQQATLPKSWNLCDDLGQIEYIFSDKTGTLTSNLMDFKKASINGIEYGKWIEPGAMMGTTPEVVEKIEAEAILMKDRLKTFGNLKYIDKEIGFVDAQIAVDLIENKLQGKRIREFFSLLAICHTVLVEKSEEDNTNGNIAYRAQSPDEAALVNAAKNIGFVFLNREENKIELELLGEKRIYTVLNIMEFNSDRKRMSVIIQRPEGDIVLMCKGADSVIYDRLDEEASKHIITKTSAHLQSFANSGIFFKSLS